MVRYIAELELSITSHEPHQQVFHVIVEMQMFTFKSAGVFFFLRTLRTFHPCWFRNQQILDNFHVMWSRASKATLCWDSLLVYFNRRPDWALNFKLWQDLLTSSSGRQVGNSIYGGRSCAFKSSRAATKGTLCWDFFFVQLLFPKVQSEL